MLAATAVAAASTAPLMAESLQHSAMAGQIGYSFKDNSLNAIIKYKNLQNRRSMVVDFSSFTLDQYEILEGNILVHCGSHTQQERTWRPQLKWTIEQLHAEMAEPASKQ